MFRAETQGTQRKDGRSFALLRVLCASARNVFVLSCLIAGPVIADEINDAVELSLQAQRAAKESQARVTRLDDEARALRQQQDKLQFEVLQTSAYAQQLEQEAAKEEKKKAEIEAEMARVAATQKELLPLMQRMVGQLEAFVAQDLPFSADQRKKRIAALKELLADPNRGLAEKYRRVLDVYRSEVEYGHSLSSEPGEIVLDGDRQAATLLRVGRVGLYALTNDKGRPARWDRKTGHWEPLDRGAASDLKRAQAVAKGDSPPEILVLPVDKPAP
jgi:hypothetical protein